MGAVPGPGSPGWGEGAAALLGAAAAATPAAAALSGAAALGWKPSCRSRPAGSAKHRNLSRGAGPASPAARLLQQGYT